MIIAIDPGTGGGFAWSDGKTIQAMEMPKKEKVRNGKVQLTPKGKPKFEVDEGAIYEFLFKQVEKDQTVEIVIEHQQVWHGDTEGFKQFRMQALLDNYKAIKTFAKVLNIPVEPVVARVWQKKYKPIPKDYNEKKRYLKQIAQKRFARLKPNAKTADALLILEHALLMK